MFISLWRDVGLTLNVNKGNVLLAGGGMMGNSRIINLENMSFTCKAGRVIVKADTLT